MTFSKKDPYSSKKTNKRMYLQENDYMYKCICVVFSQFWELTVYC